MSHDGLVLVDKPPGCTSHDVVQSARRLLRQRKIGHCGTLDPDATGLLLLTLGRATRLTRFLIRAPKVYTGELQLGIATDTYDASGQVLSEAKVDSSDEQVQTAMAGFVGTYRQLPPAFSAKKVGGRKLYELAREGREVPRQATEVQVFEFTQTSPLAAGRIGFRLSCSSGTYARSLAHDLGDRLGCGGHLLRLERIRIGHFALESAADLERLTECEQDPERLGEAWIPFDEIPLPFGTATLEIPQQRRVLNGQTVLMPKLEAVEGDWIKLSTPQGRFVAVGTVIETIGDGRLGVIQPRIVFK